MNVVTIPSGKVSINLERVVAILNRNDYIVVLFDVPAEAGGMCELRFWYEDATALLAAYQNQKENTDES